jgi:hypothetical protein
MPEPDEATPGLSTFVGRVRGRLDPVDQQWVARTSDAISALRRDLVAAAGRLGDLEARLDPFDGWAPDARPEAPGPDATDESGEPWPRLVAWAGAVNAVLVEREAEGVSTCAREIGARLRQLRGEQVVDELLTAGVLVAPPGTVDAIPFAEHGAWDLELLGSGGVTLARADVRITDDAAEVLAHVAARPGVDLVYTATDAADGLVDTEGVHVVRPGDTWPSEPAPLVVVDLGTDAAALHADLTAALDADGSRASATALLDAVPVLALLVVATRAAVRSATTDEPGADIATSSWRQTRDVVATVGVSELVGWASGMNLLKVPATLSFSLGRAAVRDARASVSLSVRRASRARRLIAACASGARPD